jgi:hypothetical protein
MSHKSPKECPDNEALARAFLGDTQNQNGRELLEHVWRCPCCRPKMQALAKVKAALDAQADRIPETGLAEKEARALRQVAAEELRRLKPPARSPWVKPVPVAAAALVAVIALAAGYFYLSDAVQSRFTMRGAVSQELRLQGPGLRLGEAPADFSWNDVPGRDDFLFSLIDEDLNTIYELETHETSLRLPEAERQKLIKGKCYLWSVLAVDDTGRGLASASREFKLE